MNYMWKFMSNFKEFYNEINSATLTGAIDVIVVQQQDGTYLTSPFHVRFGKIGVLRSREKVVDIEVNGEPVDIRMKLGESGEAFFVEETDDPTEFPSYLATSPIPSYSDIEEAMKNERAPVKPPPNSSTNFYPWESLAQSESKPMVIQSSPRSSSVSGGFTAEDATDAIVERDQNQVSQDDKPESPVKPHLTSMLSSSLKEESGFGPSDCTAESCESPAAVDSSRDASLEVTKEDMTKARRKKRKKMMLKRRRQCQQQPGAPDTAAAAAAVASAAAAVGDIETDVGALAANTVASELEPEHPEDIFAMDEILVQGGVYELDSPNDDLQDVIVDEQSWQNHSLPTQRLLHRYSDGEVSPSNSLCGSRPSTPKSDTEYELKRMDEMSDYDEHRWSWTWGELPVPPKNPCENLREDPASDDDSSDKAKQIKKDQEEQRSMLGGVLQFMRMSKTTTNHKEEEQGGMYLEDLLANDLDPEIANLYLARNASANEKSSREGVATKDEDTESGNGSSLPHSPHSVEGGIGGGQHLDSDSEERSGDGGGGGASHELKEIHDISFSLCGDLNQSNIPDSKFEQALVTFENFCSNPTLINNPNLVIRIDGKFYNWQTAAPMVMSLLVFQRPLPTTVVTNLIKDHMPKKPSKTQSKGYSWFSWRRSSGSDGQGKKPDELMLDWNAEPPLQMATGTKADTSTPKTELDHSNNNNNNIINQSTSGDVLEITSPERLEKYKKSLRLSSEQIVMLNLKEGSNEAVFSVTTAYQGTTRCKCHIYLWKYDDRIIISDIDGTITKSDVLGHILPIVGRSWAQSGVAQLFTNIKNNGYQFLYLSARAIGQARITRDYLRSIRQGDVSLPDGPLLLSPSSLISALHREVIEKKPEAFKISCLRDIQALFPNRNPFYSGYGNKINDVWAYRAVGIPMSRIFTINHRGELKHELNSTLKSSYSSLSYVVDHVFPPLRRTKLSNGFLTSNFTEAEEYSSFTFWRHTPSELSVDDIDVGKVPIKLEEKK